MILYQLVCDQGHSFESWFRDSKAYDVLADAKGLSCAVCGSSSVSKALMAPRLARRKGQDDRPQPAEAVSDAPEAVSQKTEAPSLEFSSEVVEKVGEFFEQVRQHVESSCDYVGDQFAEEARKIHYGETEARGIYGEASVEETKALKEEGVDILAIPGRRSTS